MSSQEVMNTVPPMYEWNTLPWKQIQKNVFKLQKRIYQASSRGNVKTVHRLQRLLVSSFHAKCLAVRKVTQDNQGKQTAGVDGVKSVAPAIRMVAVLSLSVRLLPTAKALVSALNLTRKPKPLRRVWIPKPGTEEKRPLGIPTIWDRACQALLKLVMEPEWEAKFEANSYGFRPGRSCHDAIEALFINIRTRPKYVLDADIEKCFDRISHEALLKKTQSPPKWRRLIQAWLKAGFMDEGQLFPTESGTPQGGVISPLLANIALHGMENHLMASFPKYKDGKPYPPKLIRYADDLVVLHPELEVIEQSKEIITLWLKEMGLQLKPSKTRISHTLKRDDEYPGFDFLGFNVRQYPVGKTHSGKLRGGKLLGFKTLIKPSKTGIKRHSMKLKEVVRRSQTVRQVDLIQKINPVIRGWSNYYSSVVSKRVFSLLDHQLYWRLRRWATRRHPNKSQHWVCQRYWHRNEGKWDFRSSGKMRLRRHDKTAIQRHVKVKETRSPFDGDWVYWSARMGRHALVPTKVAILIRKQKGKCNWCNLYVTSEDKLEIDHIQPKWLGGLDEYANWQLLHIHCHDQKSVDDNSSALKGIHDKSPIIEEPDAPKGASPVLKTSWAGDRPA